jgi:hypothetical protein
MFIFSERCRVTSRAQHGLGDHQSRGIVVHGVTGQDSESGIHQIHEALAQVD